MSMSDEAEAVPAFEALLLREEQEEEQAESEELAASADEESQPEDEADEAETEADDEAEEEAETDSDEDDDTEEEEQEGADAITVEIDGQTRTLTADEVKSGIMLEADYRRKTAEISNERKALAEQRNAFEAEKQQAIASFNERLKVLQELQDPEPEWDSDDPIGSMERQRAWDKKNKGVQAKLQEHYQELQKQQQETAFRRQQQMQQQAQMLPELIPEWKDPTIAQRETGEIADFLRSNGFTQEEINSVNDARLVKVLRMAAKGTQMTEAKKTVVKKKTAKAPRVQKPGTTPKKNVKASAAKQSMSTARRSQRPQDWQKAFIDGGFV